MKIGAVFPHLEIGSDPIVLRDWAQAAEDLGYSHILAYDHVIGAVHTDRDPKLWGPYTEKSSFHEPFVLFGYFAAMTQRIELATGILILPQRQTVLVAKQAAEIDLLSCGRLRLGVGTGWNYVEYDSLNENFDNRGARQEDQIQLLRALWEQPVIDYSSDYHRVERAGLKPLPKRSIPIWFGGFAPVAFRRAARIGDGFIYGSSQAQNLLAHDQVRRELDNVGRDTEEFGFEALVNYQSGKDTWRDEIETWTQAGAGYVSMRAMGRGDDHGLESPQDHIDALHEYWRVVADLAE